MSKKRINGIISDDLKKHAEMLHQNNLKADINPKDFAFEHEMVIKKEVEEESAEIVVKKEIKVENKTE